MMGRWPAQERYAQRKALEALVAEPFPEEPRHTRIVARELVSDWSETMATAPDERRSPEVVREAVRLVLAQVSERERFVICRYLGLDGKDDGPTLKEIGKELGVSGTRVQYLLYHALERLRHPAVWLKLGDLRELVLPERSWVRWVKEEREERLEAERAAQMERERQERQGVNRAAAWWRYPGGRWVAGPPGPDAQKVA